MHKNFPNSSDSREKQPRTAVKMLLAALICAGLIAGCEQISKTTYPDDFVYLEQKKITSEMELLSLYLREIDQILLDEYSVASEQQQRIVSILAKIDASADKLGAGSVRTNHLVLDDHIDQFKSDIGIALRDASSDPPNYFALGKLSGSCLACHKYRNL